MATEQDWAAYADQAYLAYTDTLLARTAAGAGVEIAGEHIVSKKTAGGPHDARGANTFSSGTIHTHNTCMITSNATSNSLFFGFDTTTGRAVIQAGDRTNGLKYDLGLNPYGGNIGIGTTTPGGKIDVYTASGDHIKLSGASTDAALVVSASTLVLGSWGNPAFRFHVELLTGHIYPGADNVSSVGGASNRWSVVYAGTGTINTSDEREKTWRGQLTKAEYEAGKQIINELGFYQWKDAIKKKGKNARIHFGARAQQVWAIFAKHGLVEPIKKGKPGNTPYSFLCYDEWDEKREPVFKTKTRKIKTKVEDGITATGKPKFKTVLIDEKYQEQTGERVAVKAGNRFGLRTTDLALFLLAVNARRQSELEARLAALEGAATA